MQASPLAAYFWSLRYRVVLMSMAGKGSIVDGGLCSVDEIGRVSSIEEMDEWKRWLAYMP
jgi:hypothetical protein